MVYTINPTSAGIDFIENKILYHFLMKNKDKEFFQKNVQYDLKIKNNIYSFKLTHDILPRKRESNPNQFRYEIITNQSKLDNGSFGQILLFEGTLWPTPDKRMAFKNTHQRVDKRQNFHAIYKLDYQEMAQKEYENYKLVNPFLGTKSPCFVGEQFTHMPMHLLSGKNLKNMIDDGDIKTIDDMLKISIALIRAYHEQVHANDVIHCDAKPENIFINPATGEVIVIDFGLTVKRGELVQGGTFPYADHKQVSLPADESYDIHALGFILGEIWRKWTIPDDVAIPLQGPDSFDHLGLTPNQKLRLENVIKNAIHTDPTKRISLTSALTCFEEMRIERKAKDQTEFDLLEKSQKVGAHAREAYRQFVKAKHDKAIQQALFDDMLKIDSITDKNQAALVVEEFVETLGIKVFKGLSTTAALRNKFNLIRSDYRQHLRKLHNLKRDVDNLTCEPELKEHIAFLQIEMERVTNKNKKYDVLNVDTMNCINEKFDFYTTQFAEQIAKLKKMNTAIVALKAKESKPIPDYFTARFELINKELASLPDEPLVMKLFAKRAAEVLDIADFKKIRTAEQFKKNLSDVKDLIQIISDAKANAHALINSKLEDIDKNKEALLDVIKLILDDAWIIKLVTKELASVPGFKEFEQINTLEELETAAVKLADKLAKEKIDREVAQLNELIEDPSNSFSHVKNLLEASIKKLPNDTASIVKFVDKIHPSLFGDVTNLSKSSLLKDLKLTADNVTLVDRLFYQAKQMQQLASTFKPKNRFAIYLDKLIADKHKNINEFFNINKIPTSFDKLSFVKIYSIAKYALSMQLAIGKYVNNKINTNRIVMADVLDELVVAPKNYQNENLIKTAENFKAGILSYINATYTSTSFLFRDRAASDRRLTDMYKLLTDINTAKDPDELVRNVELQLNQIKTGIFKRSSLVDIMRERVNDYRYPLRSDRRL